MAGLGQPDLPGSTAPSAPHLNSNAQGKSDEDSQAHLLRINDSIITHDCV